MNIDRERMIERRANAMLQRDSEANLENRGQGIVEYAVATRRVSKNDALASAPRTFFKK